MIYEGFATLYFHYPRLRKYLMKYVNVDAMSKEYEYETHEQAVAATVDSPIRWKAIAIPVLKK